jgi:hypothetical protein
MDLGDAIEYTLNGILAHQGDKVKPVSAEELAQEDDAIRAKYEALQKAKSAPKS